MSNDFPPAAFARLDEFLRHAEELGREAEALRHSFELPANGNGDLPVLNATAKQAAKTIRDDGPIPGKQLAKELDKDPDYVRGPVVYALRPLGLENDHNGEGYYFHAGATAFFMDLD